MGIGGRRGWTGRDRAGLPTRRTLCGRRGRSCRYQSVQVLGPEASSRSLPLPAPSTAGEGRRGQQRVWLRATGVATSVQPRAWRAGRARRGPAHQAPGNSGLGPGHLVGASGLTPRRTPAQSPSYLLSIGPRGSFGEGLLASMRRISRRLLPPLSRRPLSSLPP